MWQHKKLKCWTWFRLTVWVTDMKKVKEHIVLSEIHLRTTGRHLSNGITQCYLLPDRGGRPAFTPTGQVDTRFIDPVRIKGWVGLVGWLHTETVTHTGTNRVWRSATTLIEANALPLSQTAKQVQHWGKLPSWLYKALKKLSNHVNIKNVSLLTSYYYYIWRYFQSADTVGQTCQLSNRNHATRIT